MQKKLLLSLLFLSIFHPVFSQNKIADVLKSSQNKEKQQADSLFKIIQITKDDTLRADMYFQYFELSLPEEWIKYAPEIIKSSDSLLKNNTLSFNMRKAFLNRKAMALRYCAYYYNDGFSEKSISYFIDAIKGFAEAGNDVEVTQTYLNLADHYFSQGNLFKQYQTLQEGLKYETKRKFKNGISNFYTKLQLFYADIGDTVQVLNYIDKKIKLEMEIKDPTRLASGYYFAGLTYSKMLKHQKAIDYLLLSIKNFENKNMKNRERYLGRAYILLGDEYQNTKEYDMALDVYDKAIDYGTKSEDLRTTFLATLAKGVTMSLKGKFNEAVKIHNYILKLALGYGSGNENPVRLCNIELAQDYFRNGEFSTAKKYIENALKWAKRQNLPVMGFYDMEKIAYQIDSAGKYFEDAFQHYQQYNLLKEKINNDEALKLAAKERFSSEILIQKSEQQKKDAIAKKEIEQQKIVRNSFVGGFALMFVLAGVSYRNFRRKKKDNQIITQQKTEVENQKHLVEEKNREILDSIEYALRIQTAILPPQKIVKQYLENSFILYKPKDIVAGDFYWMETALSSSPEGGEPILGSTMYKELAGSISSSSGRSGETILFAACDCTGHGVPGAMVSVVCHNALNRAVREFGLTQPAAILDKTTEIVLENFSKSEEEIQDGMDISICAIHLPSLMERGKGVKLEWAGANNPLWIVPGEASPSGRLEGLIETKADKQCIGYNHEVKPFTNHTFNLNRGDTIYIFSDGFADQFGGQPERKLTKNRFKKLLLSIQHLSLPEQAKELDNFITNYKKDIEQTDDILVIGVRV